MDTASAQTLPLVEIDPVRGVVLSPNLHSRIVELFSSGCTARIVSDALSRQAGVSIADIELLRVYIAHSLGGSAPTHLKLTSHSNHQAGVTPSKRNR
jgi:hypothetical protein